MYCEQPADEAEPACPVAAPTPDEDEPPALFEEADPVEEADASAGLPLAPICDRNTSREGLTLVR
jgi:hypothetical protein